MTFASGGGRGLSAEEAGGGDDAVFEPRVASPAFSLGEGRSLSPHVGLARPMRAGTGVEADWPLRSAGARTWRGRVVHAWRYAPAGDGGPSAPRTAGEVWVDPRTGRVVGGRDAAGGLAGLAAPPAGSCPVGGR